MPLSPVFQGSIFDFVISFLVDTFLDYDQDDDEEEEEEDDHKTGKRKYVTSTSTNQGKAAKQVSEKLKKSSNTATTAKKGKTKTPSAQEKSMPSPKIAKPKAVKTAAKTQAENKQAEESIAGRVENKKIKIHAKTQASALPSRTKTAAISDRTIPKQPVGSRGSDDVSEMRKTNIVPPTSLGKQPAHGKTQPDRLHSKTKSANPQVEQHRRAALQAAQTLSKDLRQDTSKAAPTKQAKKVVGRETSKPAAIRQPVSATVPKVVPKVDVKKMTSPKTSTLLDDGKREEDARLVLQRVEGKRHVRPVLKQISKPPQVSKIKKQPTTKATGVDMQKKAAKAKPVKPSIDDGDRITAPPKFAETSKAIPSPSKSAKTGGVQSPVRVETARTVTQHPSQATKPGIAKRTGDRKQTGPSETPRPSSHTLKQAAGAGKSTRSHQPAETKPMQGTKQNTAKQVPVSTFSKKGSAGLPKPAMKAPVRVSGAAAGRKVVGRQPLMGQSETQATKAGSTGQVRKAKTNTEKKMLKPPSPSGQSPNKVTPGTPCKVTGAAAGHVGSGAHCHKPADNTGQRKISAKDSFKVKPVIKVTGVPSLSKALQRSANTGSNALQKSRQQSASGQSALRRSLSSYRTAQGDSSGGRQQQQSVLSIPCALMCQHGFRMCSCPLPRSSEMF